MSEYFYNETIKKYINLFGTLFSNIKVFHGTKEIRVPVKYGNKSKMYIEIKQNNSEDIRPGEILLPVMSYRMSGIDFDIEKKTQNLKIYSTNQADNKVDFIYLPKPFNINFDLYVWTKYENDMYQILEQILYNYSANTNILVNIFPEINMKKNLILILNDNANETENEEYGQDNTLKEMKWRLSFTIKGFLFSATYKENLIKIVTANYKNYDENNDPDPDSVLEENIFEVNPFDSNEEDNYNIKYTKTVNDKIYITFMEK